MPATYHHVRQGEDDDIELLARGPPQNPSSRTSSIFEPLSTSPLGDGYRPGHESKAATRNSTRTRDRRSTGPGYTRLFTRHRDARSGFPPSVFGRWFTSTPETASNNSALPRSRQRRFSGWRFGVIASACLTAAVFLLNLVLTIWASTNFPVEGNIGTLIAGDCGKSKSWGTWLHLAINILSTTILGASNYTMQCLLAPTRQEIDRAHSRRSWLAIGVPSIRNITAISWKRSALFVVLVTTSVPLHLMFNSAIFETTTARTYSVFVVSESFLTGGQYNDSVPNPTWGHFRDGWVAEQNSSLTDSPLSSMQRNLTGLQRLSPSDCIAAYGSGLVTDRGSLLAVTTREVVNSSLCALDSSVLALYAVGPPKLPPFDSWMDSMVWICTFLPSYNPFLQACNIQAAQASASMWTIFDQPIDYCLSRKRESFCTLEFSQTIMIIVICCNAVKAVCMTLAVWDSNGESLVTVGDAAASFLEHPDSRTTGRCLSVQTDLTRAEWQDKSIEQQTEIPAPGQFSLNRKMWLRAPSVGRWLVTMVLCVAAIATCGGLLGMSLQNLSNTGSSSVIDLWNMGFGAINLRSVIAFSRGGRTIWYQPLIAMVLLANTPQVILSTLYFMYNAIYTAMVSEDEWQRFSHQRKALRVTSPEGEQRSTYFLSLPYRYAIPLIVISSIMHWLVSQSIFLASVVITDENGIDTGAGFTTCGWSSIAIIFVIFVGSLMILTAFAMGFLRLKGTMPLAGGCSAVISAACHPPSTDAHASLLPVKWGAVIGVGEAEGEVGHCTLTSEEVAGPVEGRLYA